MSYLNLGSLLGMAYLLVFALIVLVAVVLVRLMLAATRTLNVITTERTLRTDLLLAEESDEPDKPEQSEQL